MTDEVDDWWARLAATLTSVADRVGRLAERVAADWDDDRGRERVERFAALRRDLDEEAEAAQRSAGHRDGDADPQALDMRLPTLLVPGSTADRRQGVRLPGTEVERVDDEPGVELPGS